MSNEAIQQHIETIASYIETLDKLREDMVSIKLPLNQGGKDYTAAFKNVESGKKNLLKTIDELHVAIAKNDAENQTSLL